MNSSFSRWTLFAFAASISLFLTIRPAWVEARTKSFKARGVTVHQAPKPQDAMAVRDQADQRRSS